MTLVQRDGSAEDVKTFNRIQGVRAKRSMATSIDVELSDSKPPQTMPIDG